VHRTSNLPRPCAPSLLRGASAESAGTTYAEPAEDASAENARAEPAERRTHAVHAEEG